jgi:hypothetical protein
VTKAKGQANGRVIEYRKFGKDMLSVHLGRAVIPGNKAEEGHRFFCIKENYKNTDF